ncbi:MAG: metallopeptidase TldD-related protein, partial [Planctomycetota bacterium]
LEASTGHAAGGARSLPGISCHALCVAPGEGGSREELLATLGRGLYVERFSGSVDAASGDFSGVAKSARWVENGEIVRPVTETLLAGNSFDLLRGSLVLGSEAERRGGSARIPAALVDGIDVTAG